VTVVRTADKPRERLNRAKVIDAATRIMDEEGLENVTMRRVARELGVEAMSLYNHVEDKEALFDGICERVLSDFEIPPHNDDWVKEARALASAFRDSLRKHPKVLTLMTERKHPMTSIEAMRPMDRALECLRRSGLSDHDVAQAYRSFGGFIFGFVMMETGQSLAGPPPSNDEAELRLAQEQLRFALRAAGAADQLGTFVELIPELGMCDADADFQFGMDLLLAGLRSRIHPKPSKGSG
jgi:TetR/AcrR family transcriptional regulator, tetracycline repressor protein